MKYPSMRRHDREIPKDEALKIIEASDYGVLSLCDGNLPYGVPLNPVIHEDTIYFHCAKEGFKLDILNKNPYGHFVFISSSKVIKESFTTSYESAMAHGSLRFVSDPKERMLAYQLLIGKYVDADIKSNKEYIEKHDKATALVAMDIKGISAKANRKT